MKEKTEEIIILIIITLFLHKLFHFPVQANV